MPTPLEIFCCYAREDQMMLEQLKKHLMLLQRQSQIVIWSDTDLNAGIEWEKELHQHLESANIILLLISPDFMSSDYCYSTEMQRAIERHEQSSAKVIPILLRPTFWQSAPFAKLQMLPTNATPITNWLDRDQAFHDITKQIYRVISELQKQRPLDQASKLALEKTPGANVGSQTSISPFIAKPDALEVLFTYKDSVRGVALSANGQILAAGSPDRIKLWDVRKGELLHTLTGHIYNSQNIALSADGQTLASGFGETIKLWNAQTGQPIRTLDHAGEVESIALSADGRTLASSGKWSPTIKLWDVQTGRLLHTLVHHKEDILEYIENIALSADGKTLASCSHNMIKLWDVRKGRAFGTLPYHNPLLRKFLPEAKDKGSIEKVALSANGRTLATVHSSDNFMNDVVKLWDARNGKLLHTTGNFSVPPIIALSADGLLLAWGSVWRISFWDVQIGRLICFLKSDVGIVRSITFSGNGLLLACSGDEAIEVWGVRE